MLIRELSSNDKMVDFFARYRQNPQTTSHETALVPQLLVTKVYVGTSRA